MLPTKSKPIIPLALPLPLSAWPAATGSGRALAIPTTIPTAIPKAVPTATHKPSECAFTPERADAESRGSGDATARVCNVEFEQG